MRYLLKSAFTLVSRITPNAVVFNFPLAVLRFYRKNGRFPRSSRHPSRTLSDYIFHRMINPKRFSCLERACVDKQWAKVIARGLYANVSIAETVAVFKGANIQSVGELRNILCQYLDLNLIAKVTSGSGAVVFINRETLDSSHGNIVSLFTQLRNGLFHTTRETQYYNLENNIIIEKAIGCNVLNDYKIFCFHGRPMYMQIDSDRYTSHAMLVIRLTDHAIMYANYDYPMPTSLVLPTPDILHKLISSARALSAPFDFVRIDLYEHCGYIYFGEFTFTPGAGCSRICDSDLFIELVRELNWV